MKITFCAYDWPPFVGGCNTWLQRLLPALRKRGIESEVFLITLAPDPECPLLNYLRQQGFNCSVIPQPHYTENRGRWILQKLTESPPDIFVPNLMVPAFHISRWVREAGIPTVGVLHSDEDYYWGIVDEFVRGYSAYQLSCIVCVSRAMEQEILKQHPPRTQINRIPYGVPVPQKTASPPTERLRIAYLGRLIEKQKRISDVTHALCRATREVFGTEAILYGGGPDRDQVEQILQSQGAELPITLAGSIDNKKVQSYLLKCHVLVLLSDFEGLPIAVMEAMACGVVPVCFKMRSGIPELVEDGVTGLIVNDRGDDFVAAIRRLREEPGLWERLSQAARAKIEAEYSSEVCAEQYAQLFQELKANAGQSSTIQIPTRFQLPPVAPIFTSQDQRQPSTYERILKKSRMYAGAIKHRLVGK